MFGARKRIGYISPSVLEVVPFDFYRFAPEGVGLVGVTCNIDDWTQEHFDRALGQVKEAAAYLGARQVDYIIHGGGPLVVARGKGYEDAIVKDIEAAAKVPATTGVRSGMEALRHVGARRIAIASPYPERHNAALSAYLTAHGFEVARAEGKDLPFKDMQNLPPADIHAFAARRPRSRRRLRRALSPLPAMAGGAGGRRARARTFAAGRLLHACQFLRRVPDARHQRSDPRPRPPAGVVVGGQVMRASRRHRRIPHRLGGRRCSRPIRRRLLSRQDRRNPGRRRGRRRLRRGGAADRQSHASAHSRQSGDRRAQHAGRNRPDHDQSPLQRRAARRHGARHADQQRADRAAAAADLARRQRDQIRHRPLWMDRHAAAGAAGDLGVAHGAGKERRRPEDRRRS